MNKIVVLNLEKDSNKQGFSVTLQIGDEGLIASTQKKGYLTLAPVNIYQTWQSAYARLPIIRRLESPSAQIVNVSEPEECRLAVTTMAEEMNRWFNAEQFRPLQEKLYSKLQPSQSIRFVIQTEDKLLRQLPWHLWHFFDDYPNAEITLSPPCYDRDSRITYIGLPKSKIRILAILGNSQGINIEKDRAELEQIPNAKTKFLIEPSRETLSDRLWEQTWDILFFAGHSGKGKIALNPENSIALSELKSGLTKARKKGLHLAIFNSCDGLELAQQLEELQIPQIIVMREPVPDNVAQKFLMCFIKALATENSVYLAMRRARERLAESDLELDIPGASWLPVMCRNLASSPLVWQNTTISSSISQSQSEAEVRADFTPTNSRRWNSFLIKISAIFLLGTIVTSFLLIKLWNVAYIEHKSSLGFQIKYPANWEQPKTDKISQNVLFIIPLKNDKDNDKFQQYFSIQKHHSQLSSMDDFNDFMLNSISVQNPQIIIYPREVKLSNFNAQETIYTSQTGFVEIKVRQLWFLNGSDGYIFTYQAEAKNFDKYYPKIEKIISSFNI